MNKRTSYISAEDLPLAKKPLLISGYDKKEKFVCRLEINAAGVAVYIGEKGNTELCDLSWEALVEQLKK
jgi:hypothetical protein